MVLLISFFSLKSTWPGLLFTQALGLQVQKTLQKKKKQNFTRCHESKTMDFLQHSNFGPGPPPLATAPVWNHRSCSFQKGLFPLTLYSCLGFRKMFLENCSEPFHLQPKKGSSIPPQKINELRVRCSFSCCPNFAPSLKN